MSLNGVWKIEMLGPYGWEAMSTAFLEDGTYKGGARNHYSLGEYSISGDKVSLSIRYVTHGKARTMFGKKAKDMNLKFDGDIKGELINGRAREDGSEYSVTFRATRLADLP